MGVEDLRPGDKMVMTLKAIAHGLARGRRGGVTGDLIRVVRCYSKSRVPGGLLLSVRLHGIKTPYTYHPDFWRKLAPGEEVDVPALLAEGNKLRGEAGLPPIEAPHITTAVPSTKAVVTPDTMVWALAPGGRSFEISRRLCRLREVPTGWGWEVADDD